MPLEAIATTPIRCQRVKPDPECEVSVAGGGIQDWSRAGISGISDKTRVLCGGNASSDQQLPSICGEWFVKNE